MSIIAPGNYKAKAIKSTVQLGESDKGSLQLAVDMDVKAVVQGPDGKWVSTGDSIGTMTTFMYFTDGAAVYSWERLGLLGWKGKGPDDIGNFDGIDANEVDVRVTAPESYKANDGSTKMGVSKLEIVTGSSHVTLNKPLDPNTFKARLKALGTAPPAAAGGTTTTAAGKGTAPPF
jgi:hypothetical protein